MLLQKIIPVFEITICGTIPGIRNTIIENNANNPLVHLAIFEVKFGDIATLTKKDINIPIIKLLTNPNSPNKTKQTTNATVTRVESINIIKFFIISNF